MIRLNTFALGSFYLIAATGILNYNSPALAQTSGCGSGKSWYLTQVATPVSARQFRVACDEHDACYDTYGKSKQECDKAFHNRMLGICARDHNTILGRPLKIACNGRADAFYTAVLEGGQDSYNKAQAAAKKQSNSACVSVDSRQGWQRFNLGNTFNKVSTINGGWSVDTRNYSTVGALGHTGSDAERLAPYNQYKYDQNFPFGALIVDIPTDGHGYIWVQQPQQLPKPISETTIRINDADNALGDNGGSLQVCFGN